MFLVVTIRDIVHGNRGKLPSPCSEKALHRQQLASGRLDDLCAPPSSCLENGPRGLPCIDLLFYGDLKRLGAKLEAQLIEVEE